MYPLPIQLLTYSWKNLNHFSLFNSEVWDPSKVRIILEVYAERRGVTPISVVILLWEFGFNPQVLATKYGAYPVLETSPLC